jgi:hypothetical protein
MGSRSVLVAVALLAAASAVAAARAERPTSVAGGAAAAPAALRAASGVDNRRKKIKPYTSPSGLFIQVPEAVPRRGADARGCSSGNCRRTALGRGGCRLPGPARRAAASHAAPCL